MNPRNRLSHRSGGLVSGPRPRRIRSKDQGPGRSQDAAAAIQAAQAAPPSCDLRARCDIRRKKLL